MMLLFAGSVTALALYREVEDDGGLHGPSQAGCGVLVDQQLLGLRVGLDRFGDVNAVAGLEDEQLGALGFQIGGRRGLDLVVGYFRLAAQVADAGSLFRYAGKLPRLQHNKKPGLSAGQ